MGTTLVEELGQAAFRAEVMAQETTSARAGVRWMHLMKGHMDEAARLRARAERVRKFEREMAQRIADNLPLRPGVLEVFHAINRVLPTTPPETPGDPQERGQP